MGNIILKILILGGTHFLGPHLVNELQEHGHEVTLFNRGKTQVNFSNVECLRGDRDGHLEALEGRNWDAVIDTCGYLPRIVESSSKILAPASKHYTFISTICVYKDFLHQNPDETYPLATLDDEKTEKITEKTYGALKAACEAVVSNYFPDRCLIVRPGLIVGPLDRTDRLSYWPHRFLRGGQILAPGSPSQPLQFIDVRDLSKWIVSMIEQQAVGIYNATGPSSPITFGELLQTCQETIGGNSAITWVNEDFLIEHGIKDWAELPLWVSSKRNVPGFLNININKALQAGLKTRPLSETIRAVVEENKPIMGLNPQKEETLLKLFLHQSG